MTLSRTNPRAKARWSVLVGAVAALTILIGTVALAAHPEVSLADSDFEIDTDANLKVDDGTPSIDWANVDDDKRSDEDSGTNDNSFGQGSKEDTAVPTVVSGSIPPNKSDLKDFGVYVEENADGKFLHLFWSRVQDPSGTTNMDFEFNKSGTLSGNGVTPLRSVGDLLITYDLSKGGTVPVLSMREWGGSTWGPAIDLSATGAATGAINTSAIVDGDSDGLGPLDPRTFGEASIDLDFIFDATACESFGSAYLKSRSSDSFTAALKDFIAPQPVNISNCGSVIIRKETAPDQNPTVTSFGFTSTLVADPVDETALDFDLMDDGSKSVSNVVAGTGYVVTEDDPTSLGYQLTDIDCSASSEGASYVEDEANRKVTFDVAVGETIDCTFTNSAIPQLKLVKSVTNDDGGTAVANSWTLSAAAATDNSLDFSNAGGSGVFEDVVAGDQYTMTESSVTGYSTTGIWSCTGGGTFATPNQITLAHGDKVTCTITNDDVAPKLELIKNVDNDAGGTAVATDWTLSASGTGGFTNHALSAIDAGTFDSRATTGEKAVRASVQYTLSESTIAGYSTTGIWVCSGGGTFVSPDKITLALGADVTCQITNEDDKTTPTGTTTMSWVLHDSATFAISAGAPNAGSAQITFRLFSDEDCLIQLGADETKTVTLNLAGTEASASTTTGHPTSSTGTYYWRAFFSGDAFNNVASTDCGSEVTTISASGS
jgi:Prealbumin-like fold domain